MLLCVYMAVISSGEVHSEAVPAIAERRVGRMNLPKHTHFAGYQTANKTFKHVAELLAATGMAFTTRLR